MTGGLNTKTTRIFRTGEHVSLEEYLFYVEDCLFGSLLYLVKMNDWVQKNIMTRLLLRRKFEITNNTRWKQFDNAVFNHLDFPTKPIKKTFHSLLLYSTVQKFKAYNSNRKKENVTVPHDELLLRNEIERMTRHDLRDFYFVHSHLLPRASFSFAIQYEPVVSKEEMEYFVTFIIQFYTSKTESSSCPFDLVSRQDVHRN